jgi:hypothetical protein
MKISKERNGIKMKERKFLPNAGINNPDTHSSNPEKMNPRQYKPISLKLIMHKSYKLTT